MKILKLFKVSRGESLDRIYLFKLFGFGVFLHRIHASDPGDLYHSHPWNGLSIILGAYVEHFVPYWESEADGYIMPFIIPIKSKVYPRRLRVLLNFVRAKRHHRVEVSRPTWTLFIHGRKCNQWEIVNEYGVPVAQKPWEGAEGVKSYTKAAA